MPIIFALFLTGFCFEDAGKEYAVPPDLLESLAVIESGLKADALNFNANGSFDIGLMQINSWWIRVFGLDKDRLAKDPCYNVMTGARILKQCIDRHGYNWQAVGCYNAASMNKKIDYSWKVFRALSSRKKKDGSPSAPRTAASPPSLVFEIRDLYEGEPSRP
jgi:soluble lytic murein transglycosylase-like protein